jgi:hypothetical protein
MAIAILDESRLLVQLATILDVTLELFVAPLLVFLASSCHFSTESSAHTRSAFITRFAFVLALVPVLIAVAEASGVCRNYKFGADHFLALGSLASPAAILVTLALLATLLLVSTVANETATVAVGSSRA